MPNNKIIAFDSLRVFAIFSVLLLHASVVPFLCSYPSTDWEMANVYEAISRWNVAVFIMISGALFLRKSKPLNIKRLYSKNILRIVAIFLFWSAIYAAYALITGNEKYTLFDALNGPHHFWYLKALIGLYIAIPIFKYIVSKKKFEQWFLIATFILGIIAPSTFDIIGISDPKLKMSLINYYSQFNVRLISTYSFYFVVGHYFIESPIAKCHRHILYTLGTISPLIVMMLTRYVTGIDGKPFASFLGNEFICTTLEAMAVFMLFISSSKIAKFSHRFSSLSGCVLGIYIVHILVMYILSDLGLKSDSYSATYFTPLYSIIVFAISYIIVIILKRIPFVNKWFI